MIKQFTKEKPFSRIISSTQSKYVLVKKTDGSTGQGSYNLSGELEQFLKDNNIIVNFPEKSNETNIYYVLSPNVKLKLSNRIINLIGSDYDNENNKIYFDHTIAADGTEKLQIKRTDHKNEKEYMWFQELYDKNCEGAQFKIYFDFNTRELWIDNDMHMVERELNEELVYESVLDKFEKFWVFFLEKAKEYKNDDSMKKNIEDILKFNNEYPLEKLSEMKLEEYAIGKQSGYSYEIERGKYAGTGCSVRGYTSAKFGIYLSDDGVYKDSKNKQVDNPNLYWEDFRSSLVKFLTECADIENPISIDNKYPNLKGTNYFLAKVLFLYYPNKYVCISSKGPLIELLEYFDISYSKEMQNDELSFLLNKTIREKISEVNKYEPHYLGSALWEYLKSIKGDREMGIEDKKTIDSDRLPDGYNKIIYGIPGCGKSYHVQKNIIEKDKNSGRVFRATFYPDYTNGDFVGQIIPKIDSKNNSTVIYDIQSGPFANALLNAIIEPDKYTYLIIEEINRANAAAVFGDIFQLLDRDNGKSQYDIDNYIISTFLHREIDNNYSVDYNLDKIRIPSNLIIIGTMNTSDQNVFTLDTAFKRRWQMEHITDDVKGSKFAAKTIPPMNKVTWAEFVNAINEYITSGNGLDINGEDKQIGSYFISENEWNEIEKSDNDKGAKLFTEKVLSYIWEDVAKINREIWFKEKTFDSLVDSFIKIGLNVFDEGIISEKENNDSENKE